MNTALVLQLLLIVLDKLEPLSQSTLTEDQRRTIEEARKAAVQEAEETP